MSSFIISISTSPLPGNVEFCFCFRYLVAFSIFSKRNHNFRLLWISTGAVKIDHTPKSDRFWAIFRYFFGVAADFTYDLVTALVHFDLLEQGSESVLAHTVLLYISVHQENVVPLSLKGHPKSLGLSIYGIFSANKICAKFYDIFVHGRASGIRTNT